jgi:2-methylcitrate dehydratase PrpD
MVPAMSATHRLAEFVQKTRLADCPEPVLAQVRRAALDTIGCMLAGAGEPVAAVVRRIARAEGGTPLCRVFGTSLRTSPTWAALANGAAAHALDFDDMCFVSLAHPSAPLVATALAMGEYAGASGRALLEAYVAGFEVEAVLGKTMNPRHYQQGWHCTSTLGTLGAAAAAARILKLDAYATTNCLAIAASEASGLKENFGTMTKPLQVGLAARNAVLAALLAQQGFTANDRAIEGAQGFLTAMASEKAELQCLSTLGKRWEILETGITVKLYPSCAATHPALDAVLDLRRENALTSDQVESAEVQVDEVTPNLLIYEHPQTGLEGKFSMTFCVAAALVYGEVGLETFETSRIRDARIQALLPHVAMHVNPALGKEAPALTQALVTIRLRDGRILTRAANGARGYPDRPASAEELERKFTSCGMHALPRPQLQAALDCLHKFESLADVRELAELLSGSK